MGVIVEIILYKGRAKVVHYMMTMIMTITMTSMEGEGELYSVLTVSQYVTDTVSYLGIRSKVTQ